MYVFATNPYKDAYAYAQNTKLGEAEYAVAYNPDK